MSLNRQSLAGKTTDRRAGCGRSARPVRREGVSKPIDAPYPYHSMGSKITSYFFLGFAAFLGFATLVIFGNSPFLNSAHHCSRFSATPRCRY